MERVIGMVPARGGSVGVPMKNIRDFRSQPLLTWNTQALIDSEVCDEVYVNTDNQDIAGVALGWCPNSRVYHRRPELATDTTPTIDVVFDFINWKGLEDRDILIVSQPTSPYLDPDDVMWAYEVIHSKQCDSVLTAARFHRFVWDDEGNCINHHAMWRPRRQEWEGSLLENGCMYASRVGTIRSSGVLWGGYLAILEQPLDFELDTYTDWVVGEAIIKGVA